MGGLYAGRGGGLSIGGQVECSTRTSACGLTTDHGRKEKSWSAVGPGRGKTPTFDGDVEILICGQAQPHRLFERERSTQTNGSENSNDINDRLEYAFHLSSDQQRANRKTFQEKSNPYKFHSAWVRSGQLQRRVVRKKMDGESMHCTSAEFMHCSSERRLCTGEMPNADNANFACIFLVGGDRRCYDNYLGGVVTIYSCTAIRDNTRHCLQRGVLRLLRKAISGTAHARWIESKFARDSWGGGKRQASAGYQLGRRRGFCEWRRLRRRACPRPTVVGSSLQHSLLAILRRARAT